MGTVHCCLPVKDVSVIDFSPVRRRPVVIRLTDSRSSLLSDSDASVSIPATTQDMGEGGGVSHVYYP